MINFGWFWGYSWYGTSHWKNPSGASWCQVNWFSGEQIPEPKSSASRCQQGHWKSHRSHPYPTGFVWNIHPMNILYGHTWWGKWMMITREIWGVSSDKPQYPKVGFWSLPAELFFLIPPFQAHDAGISKFDFNDDRELVATVSHVKPLLMSGLSWRVLQILIFDVGICASRIWACAYGTSEKAHHLEQASGLLTCCALMQICGSWSRGIPSRKSWCCEMDANSQLVRRCWRCGMEAFVQSADSGDLRWFAKMSLMIGNRGLDYLI